MGGMTDVIDRAAKRLEIPTLGLAGAPRVSVTGRGQLLAELHTGLTEYSDDCIEFTVKNGRVRVRGTGLRLEAMDAGALLISGVIAAVEFL